MSYSYCKYLSLLTVGLILTFAGQLRADVGAHTDDSKVVMDSAVDVMESSWLDHAITPVSNGVWFEDARITTEARFLHMYHFIDKDFVLGKGDAQLYALQLRYAVTDKLAIIAVKDGLVNIETDAGYEQFDFADLALGVKYQAYRNDDMELIVTPGLTFEVPTGAEDVFQGNGDGMVHPFVSFTKGFDKFQIAGNAGMHIPFDFDAENAIGHYSLHMHYYVHRYFIPLFEVNGSTVITEGNGLPIDTEGHDLFNFGSQQAAGSTQVSLAVGFRSQILDPLSLGFAWEKQVVEDNSIFDHRFNVDLIYRF